MLIKVNLLHGAVVHLLQVVSDLSELGNLSPASLGGARAADAVAFAEATHRLADSLESDTSFQSRTHALCVKDIFTA
jgi:hypothetical protein